MVAQRRDEAPIAAIPGYVPDQNELKLGALTNAEKLRVKINALKSELVGVDTSTKGYNARRMRMGRITSQKEDAKTRYWISTANNNIEERKHALYTICVS